MKYFIITIDTEGDDLWHYQKGQEVKTENSLYIPRFQEICERYWFKPVWLTDYEMVCDQRYVDYIKPKMEQGLCEVGIHIHAWNNPPLYDLNGPYSGNPFLVEYPSDIMRAKFKITYDLIKEKFGVAPVSHRAGRWVMNDEYFKILEEFGVTIDCSYTPTVSWAKTPGETIEGGNDYSKSSKLPLRIGNVLEVPTTVRLTRMPERGKRQTLKRIIKTAIQGRNIWLRPACTSHDEMKALCRQAGREKNHEYLMFMMHSSEMMPGSSPYFKDVESIEKMYSTIENIFEYVRELGYEGITLRDYKRLKDATI